MKVKETVEREDVKNTEIICLVLPSKKKNVESVSMLILGGGPRASAHTSLGFFFMLQTYLVGSSKPQNNFCVHSYMNTSYIF